MMPSLTTINYPGKEIGEIVARNLVNPLQGTSNIQKTNTIILSSYLNIRKSPLRKDTYRNVLILFDCVAV